MGDLWFGKSVKQIVWWKRKLDRNFWSEREFGVGFGFMSDVNLDQSKKGFILFRKQWIRRLFDNNRAAAEAAFPTPHQTPAPWIFDEIKILPSWIFFGTQVFTAPVAGRDPTEPGHGDRGGGGRWEGDEKENQHLNIFWVLFKSLLIPLEPS